LKIEDTASQSTPRGDAAVGTADAVPALVEIYADDEPAFVVHPIATPIVIGRGDDCDLVLDDKRASRRHADVRYDGGTWRIADLGSHNGTFVDTRRVDRVVETRDEVVLAIGNRVFLLVHDARRLDGGVEVHDGVVLGPRLRAVWDTVTQLAATGNSLHVIGETGSGKEVLARRFHAVRCPRAPFVAVNCAAIPPMIAERLFFGARRGAYSGADVDAEGYLAAADGGVLFLDEIGELSLDVQAKLLRAIETREVLPLGAVKPRPLDVVVVSATHVDLRAAVGRGTFREDLYFRIVSAEVVVPPLRERREEIPWIVATALRGQPVRAHASFVELALARPWPGNVRELAGAAATARKLVPADETHLRMGQLPAHTGLWLAPRETPSTPVDPETAAVYDALRATGGNVTQTARALGLHRNQLRRWIERHAVDVRQFKRGLLVDRGD